MSTVFKPCNGAAEIQRVCDADAVLTTIQIDAAGLSSQAVITGMTLEMSGNYQFLHTLNQFIYFYAFGDRVGTLNLTGIGFIAPCAGNAGGQKGAILKIYDYYKTNRAAKSGGEAMSLVIENATGAKIQLWGFLTGMRMDITDSQMGTVGYWTLRFEVVPQA